MDNKEIKKRKSASGKTSSRLEGQKSGGASGRGTGRAVKPAPKRAEGSSDLDARRKRRAEAARRRRKRVMIQRGIAGGILAVVILLILLLVKGCGGKKDGTEKKEKEQKSAQNLEQTEMLEAEPTLTPTPAPVELLITSAGDCTLGTDSSFDYDGSLIQVYNDYGPTHFFKNVKSIFAADDLTIVNFEGTLTEAEERADKTYCFKAPKEYAHILTEGDIEAVTLANNHTKDYKDQGYQDTLAALEEENIVSFGYDRTAIMNIKGVQVGLIGLKGWMEDEDVEAIIKERVAKVKADGAQLIILEIHFGEELEQEPREVQMRLARLAVDEGCDLVIGHHPHVIQGIEVYKGRTICYSVGNFCFGGNQYPSDMDAFIYQQKFTVAGDTVTPGEALVIPVSISSEAYYNDYCPTPAEGSEYDRILNKIKERTEYFTPAQPQDGSIFAAAEAKRSASSGESSETY